MMDWNDGGGGNWWGWLLMAVGMLAFWGLIIWAVLAVARGRVCPSDPPRPTPETILRERFASGEIDEVEYRQRLDALRGQAPAPPASVE